MEEEDESMEIVDEVCTSILPKHPILVYVSDFYDTLVGLPKVLECVIVLLDGHNEH